MTAADLAVVALVAVTAGLGARAGFAGRAGAWIGAATGLVGGATLARLVAGPVASPGSRSVVALTLVLVGVVLATAIGAASDARARPDPAHPDPAHPDPASRVLAAGLATVATLVVLVAALPVVRALPPPMAGAIQGSAVLDELEDLSGLRRGPVAAWAEHLGRADPRVTDVVVPATVVDRVASSVVRITGEACGTTQDGTGWVLSTGVVVTNAHVVQGSPQRLVVDARGRVHTAVVVAYDAEADLALLEVEGLHAPPIGAPRPAQEGEAVVVTGHPGGGPARTVAARVREEIVGVTGPPGAETRRAVLVLDAALAVGDSGAPVVAADGAPVGTVFAIAPAEPDTAYALAARAHDRVLDAARHGPVDTGTCASDPPE